MSSRKHKILLIGSDGFNASNESAVVTCISWKAINNSLNLRDFDTIVLNLLAHEKEPFDSTALSGFCSKVNFSVANDVLHNQGKIIVLGDPRFAVKRREDSLYHESKESEVPFLYWTGLNLTWEDSTGDTVVFDKNKTYEFGDYVNFVNRLSRWNYSLDRVYIQPNEVSGVFKPDILKEHGWEVDCNAMSIADNRYGNLLVFEVRIGVYRDLPYGKEYVLKLGPIVFLPPISASEDETVQIVLRDLCGFDAALPEPPWIKDFKAPGQKQVDDEIVRLESEIKGLQQRLGESVANREKCRAFLKLLYDREFGLEPAVREVLRVLGAQVEDPKEKNKEDGWITVVIDGKTYEGVLEIKSTRHDTFPEDGRKQVIDWVNRGISQRAKKYKGIFIGNSAVNEPVDKRQDPFPDSWKKAAVLSEMCAMTSTDLYVIYVLKTRGILEVDVFWREVFSTNGIFDARKYHDAIVTKDK